MKIHKIPALNHRASTDKIKRGKLNIDKGILERAHAKISKNLKTEFVTAALQNLYVYFAHQAAIYIRDRKTFVEWVRVK